MKSILMLKYGTKYSAEDVNKIVEDTGRKYTYVCFTDDPTGLDPIVVAWPLPDDIEGHWYSILSHKIKNTNMPISEISKIYAILGLTINEAYKIGEYEEYKTTYISPNNIIKNNLDQNWQPYLKNNINEFNSITSIVSLSASNIISNYLKDNSAFIDSSIYKYTGRVRNYNSLEEAASEASISRAYGGIHYIFTANEAAGQGKFLASKILNQIK